MVKIRSDWYFKRLEDYINRKLHFIIGVKLQILVLIMLVILFIGLFKLEIIYKNASGLLDFNFWKDKLIPNIMSDMIGIVLTTFIITYFIQRQSKNKEMTNNYAVYGKELEYLSNTLITNFLYFVHKDSNYMKIKNKQKIERLEEFIDYGFIYTERFFMDKEFIVWDLTESSPVYRTFDVKVSHVEKYMKNWLATLNEWKGIIDRKNYLKFYLDYLGEEESIFYTEKSKELELVKQKDEYLLKKSIAFKGDKNIMICDINQCSEALNELFVELINDFIHKNNILISIELRLNLKNIVSQTRELREVVRDINLKKYHSDEIYKSSIQKKYNLTVLKLAKELMLLNKFFEKYK